MTSPTLKSRHRRDPRVITDISILTKDATYEGGVPLFDDADKDPFLSPNYSQPAKNVLKGYGLKIVSPNTILELLENDLRSLNSKMHGDETDGNWYSAVANLLCSFFDRNLSLANRLRQLPLIPLRDGTWVSAALNPIYFPKTKNISIPKRLDIRVLEFDATFNIERKRLFDHLGVLEADIAAVRASILRAFSPLNHGLRLSNYKAFLHYLYLTHQPEISVKTELAFRVGVMNDQKNPVQPHKTDIYLPGETRRFSPQSLLAPCGAAPGFPIQITHATYMQNVPEKPDPSFPSWEKWLFDFVGVRERLRLVDASGGSLSEPLIYVHEHRPEKFLGLLNYLWQNEDSKTKRNEILRRNIKALSAKELCGVSYAISFGDTWLPFEGLRDHVSLYMEFPQHFPFLKIDSTESADKFSVEWSFFADHFGVNKDENLVFYLTILHYIEQSHRKASIVSAVQSQKIFNLYAAIYSILKLSRNQERDQHTIK